MKMIAHRSPKQGCSPMKGLLCIFAFLAVALPAGAEPLTLASKYDVVGTNPDGSKYRGTADVNVISNSTFTIKWAIGTSTIEGFGMRMNNSLAATYEINGEPGLVIYRLEGNGFDGLWAIRGHNGTGTEHLTPR
ncbi:MAG: hypothetical protein KGQ47_12790 [Hyphomicrobiales bacterium]|nr:hypothetical protein [Hyphomicrobiales bacterium]MDE1972669.1 hypothetical protein [Hyphomicrobiales bacterium]